VRDRGTGPSGHHGRQHHHNGRDRRGLCRWRCITSPGTHLTVCPFSFRPNRPKPAIRRAFSLEACPMANPTFGMTINRVDNEPRPAVGADLAVIGLVGTAPEADAAKFPLNTPVHIFSDDAAAATALGATGSLA